MLTVLNSEYPSEYFHCIYLVIFRPNNEPIRETQRHTMGKSTKESNVFLMQNNLITTMIRQSIENQLYFIKYHTKYLLKTYFSLSEGTSSS